MEVNDTFKSQNKDSSIEGHCSMFFEESDLWISLSLSRGRFGTGMIGPV